MRVVKLRQPGGLDRLETVELADPGQPGNGEIRVRLIRDWMKRVPEPKPGWDEDPDPPRTTE